MRFADDDLADYSDNYGSTDELIEDVVAHFKGKVSAAEAERVLELTDYDYDETIAKLEAKLKKSQPKAAPAPAKAAPSKVASTKEAPAKVAPTTNTSEPKGKLTRLQELAQRRKAGGQGSTPNNSAPSDAPQPKLSGLARLAAARASSASPVSTPSPPPPQTHKPGESTLSALAKLRQRKQIDTSGAQAGPATSSPLEQKPEQKPEPAPPKKPLISYEYKHVEQPEPSEIGRILGEFEAHPYSNTESNTAPVAPQAQLAFSKPSPDAAVAAAQASAFGQSAGSGLKRAPQKVVKPTVAPPKKKEASPKVEENIETKLARLNIKDAKPHLSFVVIGHVDAGKSTLMGRLLLDTGAVSQKLVDKYTRDSAKEGKSSFALAWVLDATEEERRRGVTVDIGEANFETDTTKFTVVDAPGHKDYVPNMIAGVAQADVALLVVDAAPSAFESGFSLDGQTKEHAVLARALGIDTCVVAVNKLDTQDWSKERFDEITMQLEDFLGKSLGFTKVSFVPTSGRDGTNVVKKLPSDSLLAKWYKGPTLVDTLSGLGQGRARDIDSPFRFLVSNAFVEPYQSSTTVTGRVLSGVLESGDVVNVIRPGSESETTKVKALGDTPTKYLAAGENGQFKADFEQPLRPGDVVAGPNANLESRSTFIARVRLFDMPRPVLVGTKLALHMGRIDRTVRVAKIIDGLGKHGKPTAKRPRHLGKGTAARVELELESPAVLAAPSVCRDLGRFVLRHNGQTVGGGMVE